MEDEQAGIASANFDRNLHIVADAMPVATWATDPDGRCEYVNDLWLDAADTTLDKVVGHGWLDYLHPDDRSPVSVAWQEFIERDRPYEVEFRIHGSRGYRWYLTRARKVRDENGVVTKIVGGCTDIQELKERTESEQSQLRCILETMPQATWTALPDGQVNYVSNGWLALTGMKLEDCLGLGWLNALHPDDRERADLAWKNFIDGKGPYDLEYRLRSEDDSYRWVLTRGLKVKNKTGEVDQVVGTCTDIQAQRAQSAELERLVSARTGELDEAMLFLNDVINSMSDGLVIADKEGNLKYLNQVAQSLYEGQNVPANVADIPVASMQAVDSETGMQLEEVPIVRALKGEVVDDFEFRWAEKVVSVSARPLIGLSGNASGAVATIRDITARKKTEQQFESARHEAFTAQETQAKLLTTVSHEVRSPMAGIVGLIELIAEATVEQKQDPEGVHGMATVALASCKRLIDILNDLLDASKLNAGAVTIERMNFSVPILVDDLIQLATPVASRKNLVLSAQLTSEIPDQLCGDQSRLRQILQNLVFNALKFTNEGKVAVIVKVSSHSNDECVLQFDVIDTGIGIPSDQQEHVFQPFAQANDSTTRKYGGTGLGLSISRTLAKLMGGDIKLKSMPGAGSTFSLTLPFGCESCVKNST